MRLDLEVYAVDLATIEREYGGCGSNVLAINVVVESNGVLAKLDAYGNVEPLGEAVFADSYFAKSDAAKTGNGNLTACGSGNLEEARNCAGSPEVLTLGTVSCNSHIGINELHLEESIAVEAEGEAVEANRIACSGEALEVINATVGSGNPNSRLTLKSFAGFALIVKKNVLTVSVDYGKTGIPTVTLAILFLGGSVDIILVVLIHICIRSIAGTVEVIVLVNYVRGVAICAGVSSLAVCVCPLKVLVSKLGSDLLTAKSTYGSGTTGSRICYVTKLAIFLSTTSTYCLLLTGSLATLVTESLAVNLVTDGAMLSGITSSFYPLVITGAKGPFLAYGEAECNVIKHKTAVKSCRVTAEVKSTDSIGLDRHCSAYLSNVLAVNVVVKSHGLVSVKLDRDSNLDPTGEVVCANLNGADSRTIVTLNSCYTIYRIRNLEDRNAVLSPIPCGSRSTVKHLEVDAVACLGGITVDLEGYEADSVVLAGEVREIGEQTAVRNEYLILLFLTGEIEKLIVTVAVIADNDLRLVRGIALGSVAVSNVSAAVTVNSLIAGTIEPEVFIGSECLGAYGTSVSYCTAVVYVAESVTCGIAITLTTYFTSSANITACSAALVSKRLALSSATALYGTGCGSLTSSIAEGMTCGFALGSVTSCTSRRKSTGCGSHIVTKSLALGSATALSLTGLGFSTSSICPIVTENLGTGGESTAGSGAGCGIVTGSAAKLVAKSGLADHVTNRTVLRLSTGCAYPSVLACFLGRATNLTGCALSTVGDLILTSMDIIRPCACHLVIVTEGDVIEHKALTCSDCRTGEVYRGYTEGESSKRLGNRLIVYAVDVVVNGDNTVGAIAVDSVGVKLNTELNVDPTGPAILINLYGLKNYAVPAFELNDAVLVSSSCNEEATRDTPLGRPTNGLAGVRILVTKRVINELKSQGKVLVIHAGVELEGKETNRVVSAVEAAVTTGIVGDPELELSAFLLPLSTSILGNYVVSRIGINRGRLVINSILHDELIVTILSDYGIVTVSGDVTSLCVNNGSHTVVVRAVKVIKAGKRELILTRGTPEGDLLSLLAVYGLYYTLLSKSMSSVDLGLKFADGTNSGLHTGWLGEDVVSGNTLGETAISTSLGRLAVSGDPIVTYCLNCFTTGVAGSGVVTADLAVAEVVAWSGSNNVGLGIAAILTGANDSAVNGTGLLNYSDLILVSESSTLFRLTNGAGLGSGAGCIYPNVAKSYALGSATAGTSLGRIAISVYPYVLKSLALGVAAILTSLRSCAGRICPVVALSLTGGLATTVTGLGSGAGSVCIVVTKLLAVFKTANFAMLCSLASCVCPYVSIGISLAFCCFTYGTGLGGLAVSVYPSMAKSFALGFTALTSLGRLAGCVCPYVLVSHSKHAENLVFNVVDSVNNRLGKHVTGSERKQKDH